MEQVCPTGSAKQTTEQCHPLKSFRFLKYSNAVVI